MTIILHEAREWHPPTAEGTDDRLWISAADVERVTGWSLRGQALCKDDVAITVPGGREADFIREGALNLAAFWRAMDKPVVHSEAGDVWVLGASAAERAAALQALEAPDFTLPDPDGNLHSLSQYRGKKVFLASWASW